MVLVLLVSSARRKSRNDVRVILCSSTGRVEVGRSLSVALRRVRRRTREVVGVAHDVCLGTAFPVHSVSDCELVGVKEGAPVYS